LEVLSFQDFEVAGVWSFFRGTKFSSFKDSEFRGFRDGSVYGFYVSNKVSGLRVFKESSFERFCGFEVLRNQDLRFLEIKVLRF
jgi:hypothetical protein